MGDGSSAPGTRLPLWLTRCSKHICRPTETPVPSSTPLPKRAEPKDRRIDRLTLWNNIDG